MRIEIVQLFDCAAFVAYCMCWSGTVSTSNTSVTGGNINKKCHVYFGTHCLYSAMTGRTEIELSDKQIKSGK